MARTLQNLRTERAIENAFIKLVSEKGFNKVTVESIATEALINRQTFYYHYQDKYDLTEKMVSNLVKDYDEFYQGIVETSTKPLSLPKRIELFFPQANSFWTANREKLAVLSSIEFNDYTLENELKKRFQMYLPALLNREALPLENEIFPAIIISVIEYIVNSGQIPTEEELIDTFQSLGAVFK